MKFSLKNIKDIWSKYRFEVFIGACIVFILIYSFIRKILGYKGSWDKYNFTSYKNYNLNKYNSSYNDKKDSKGEIETRRVLESIFKAPFKKARPDFLINPVSGGYHALELDCYNPKLKLAAEYNGEQHYKYIPFFHKNKEAFLNQKYRDDMKYRICKERGIDLIIIPYTVKINNIYSYIYNQLKYFGYKM